MSGLRWSAWALASLFAMATSACSPSSGATAARDTAASAVSGAAVITTAAALAVTTVAPQMQRWTQRIQASGSIAPFQPIDIAAPGDGLPFATVNARVGDHVRAGQVLATMNVTNVLPRRTQAQADVVEALANLEQANAQLAGSNLLNDSGAISRQALVAAQTSARVGAAHLSSARARLAAIDLELRDATLKAPTDAIVASSHATPGSVPAAGSAVFSLVGGGRLEWRAQLDLRSIASIRERQGAEVVGPDGSVVAGTVSRMSPLLDTDTQMGTAYVELPATPALKIGGVVSGTIVGARADVLSLPGSSVSTHDGFDYAWTVDNANRVHEIKLETGRRQDGRVEVLGGLPPGERVIERGVGLLNENDVVSVSRAPEQKQSDTPTPTQTATR